MMVFRRVLAEGLTDLANYEFQRRVWLGKSEGEMSSFTEAVCHTFDDSALSDLINANRLKSEFDAELSELLLKLSEAIDCVDLNVEISDMIESQEMSRVRGLANKALELLKSR